MVFSKVCAERYQLKKERRDRMIADGREMMTEYYGCITELGPRRTVRWYQQSRAAIYDTSTRPAVLDGARQTRRSANVSRLQPIGLTFSPAGGV